MTFLSEGGPKACPACGLLAPASTPRCDCSYAFRGDLSALESPGPKRIGGWLTLVALGVCAAPIIIIAQTAQLLPVFEADTWKALTTPGEPAYHPLWAPWIIAELTINLVLLAGSIVVAFLFFAKRRLFPRFMIGFMVASLTVQAFDLLAAQAIPAAAAEIGVQEVRTFLGTLSSSAIWIPYFLRSKRVRATFVKG